MPRVTVITPTWNSAATLARTLASVRAQSLDDYEHLVIDNASTDGTQALAAGLGDPRIQLTSEKDRGLYDAMNKGVAAARGEWVAILNADDVFADAGVLAQVDAAFRETGADLVYGDLDFIDAAGRVRRTWTSGPYDVKRWQAGWHPPHPAVFVRRSAYSAEPFDIRYRLAADYKFLLTMGLVQKATFAYLPRVLVKMALGGASTQGARAIVRGNREVLRAWKEIGLKAPRLLVPRKLLYKLKGKLGAASRPRPS